MSSTQSTPFGSTGTTATPGQSRALRIGLGVVTAVTGGLILVWPGGTLVVVAVVIGIQLIIGGVIRAITAFTFDASSVGARILFLLLGVLLVIAGILCLRSPLQTIAILTLLFGLSCIVSGAMELFHGFTGGGLWSVAFGIVNIIFGIIVLSYPVSTVSTLIWLIGIALVVMGLTAIIGALIPSRERVGSRAMPTSATPAHP